jgi:hypothetical protein
MGSRIAIGAVLALLIGFGVWAALPNAEPTRGDRIGGAPLGTPQPLGVPRPPAQVPRAAPAADGAPAARPADELTRRVDACVAAQREVSARRQARQGPPPEGEPSDGGVVAKACAPLFAQPGCREAHANFDTPPMAARMETLFQACVRDYCPRMPTPKPSACDKMPEDGQATLAAWTELRQAILRHDIGDAEAARAFPR